MAGKSVIRGRGLVPPLRDSSEGFPKHPLNRYAFPNTQGLRVGGMQLDDGLRSLPIEVRQRCVIVPVR